MIHTIDRLLEASSIEVLRKMIGKELLDVRTDKDALVDNTAWVAQCDFPDGPCTIQSYTDVVDYYGDPEDITILRVLNGPYEFDTPQLNTFPIGKR